METGAHYLRPAGKTHTPAAVIFADTETTSDDHDQQEVHRLRLWEARRVLRRDRRRQGQVDEATGTTGEEFAQVIDRWASYPESTWLYTHNLTFDLTVTALAMYLGRLGWVLSRRFAIGGDSMWCVFHKGARTAVVPQAGQRAGTGRTRTKWAHTLTIADSASLFPGPLAQLGPHTGIVKPPMEESDGSDAWWAERCHADVGILATAVLTLMDWWDASDLGAWTVTGAGQAWQSYKRHLDPKQVVIDHEPAILEIERAAVYGGRRDAFRVGPLPPGRYAELDYEAAYPSIAAQFPLPARAACPVGDSHRRMALAGRVPQGMLAEVTLNAASPRWPVRVGGRVFYPVGRFRTVLAAPDIAAAAAAGALEAVHEGWLFTMTSHLKQWARWVLAVIRDTTGVTPGVVRVWAKLASRAVIGKFAQKGWRTEPCVGPPCEGWSVQQVSQMYTGTRGVLTGVNGDYYLSWADQRGEHERPAVLAFVEAHVRRLLSALVTGPYSPAMVQCDTDGVACSLTMLGKLARILGVARSDGQPGPAGAADAISAINQASQPLVIRAKAYFGRGVVYGPQHVILDGRPRFAGVPKDAWQTEESRWKARLWPGITWQSQHGGDGTYVRPLQDYRVTGPYVQAWVLEDGTVLPAEATINPDGTTILLPWKHTRWANEGHILAGKQASWTEHLTSTQEV